MKKLILNLVCVSLILLIISSCSKPSLPPDGKLIDVGGYKMYLNCKGSGNPTVVMEAGFNDVSDTWALVQPEVAKITRTCVYDRAGLGLSEPGPEPRDSYLIINELKTLLEKADINGPYVLVGHSLGGMYMRLFIDQYPDEVVGLVLVDSAHIDDSQRSASVLPTVGPNESENLTSLREWLANPPVFAEIPERLFEPGSLGSLPLVVLSVPKQQRPDDLPVELRDALDGIWVDLQNEWALISTQSTHIFVNDSSHFIQKDQPEIVIDAILQVVEEAKSGL
ncbi:alpha/beta hydrolase [bacterium]|nr:alpha/beta hydrolase [bacterium]